MELTECPCCGHGPIVNRQCQKCMVMIPAGTEPTWGTRTGRRPRYKQDQDRVNKYTDYARTKEDK